MSNPPEQYLSISAWIPLGINNITELAEKIKLYLMDSRGDLRIADWDENIRVDDSHLEFILRLNSPYDVNHPHTLIVEAKFYGWGLIIFRLYPENNLFQSKTLDPNFVSVNMQFLIKTSKDIIVETLLDHQRNYLSHVLFGKGIISSKEYLLAAEEDRLDNGVTDGASVDEIKMGFRFEKISDTKKPVSEITTIDKYRNNDLLVKTLVLKSTDFLQAPCAYDDKDGDFNKYSERSGKYIYGKHRSSLLIWDQKPISDDTIYQINGYNSLIRFQRFFISKLKLVRKEVSFVRLGLLSNRGFSFAKEIPEYIDNANPTHLQGYIYYLVSRMPLLKEIMKYLNESQSKIKASSLDDQSDTNIESTINLFKVYNDDLILTVNRIISGLVDEVESARKLIEINDGEQLLETSCNIEEKLGNIKEIQTNIKQTSCNIEEKLGDIKEIQTNIKQNCQTQMITQKRSLESQFTQNEFARSQEIRNKTGRTTTQITGSAAVAGVLTNPIKNFLLSLLKIIPLPIFIQSNINAILDFFVPLSMFVVGWNLVGKILFQSHKFGDIVEITVPFDEMSSKKNIFFDEKKLLNEDENNNYKTRGNKRLHRFRIEGNTYRVTWEDEIKIEHKKVFKWYDIRRVNAKSTNFMVPKKVITTIEYEKISNKSKLKFITMSIEKSQVDNEHMDVLLENLIKLAGESLYALNKSKFSSGKEWSDEIISMITTSPNT